MTTVERRDTELSTTSQGGDFNSAASQGVEIIMRNLRYETVVDKHGTIKEIIHGVTAAILHGEMVAVMGASGAGKSTLLDILSCRKGVGSIRGDIYYNRKPRTDDLMKNLAYVQQADIHIGSLTVKETLEFAARFRMGEIPATVRAQRVRRILRTLEMEHIASSPVGGTTEAGISGGQRKRLSIGVEIINLPDLIFLDEPTSGLDSEMSYEVVAMVRKLSNNGHTTVTTIHQPSSEIFDFFDKLILLNHGRLVYCGPAATVVEFFTGSPMSYLAPPEQSNPANFVLRIAMGRHPLADTSKPLRSDMELVNTYQSTELHKENMAEIENLLQGVAPIPDEFHKFTKMGKTEQVLSQTQQYWTLFRRQTLVTMRQNITRLLIRKSVIMGIMLGTIFWQLDDDVDGANYKYSLLFTVALTLATSNVQAIAEMCEFRYLFYRERDAACYTTLAYFTIINICDLPQLIISTLGLCVPIYWLAGYRDDAELFFFFMLTCFCIMFAGAHMIQLIAAAVPTTHHALAVVPMQSLFLMLFSGYMITVESVPDMWCWVPYVNFLRWGFEALSINEFEDSGCYDDDSSSHPNACVPDEQILDNFDFNDDNKWTCLSILVLEDCALMLATYLTLRFVAWTNK